MKSPPILENPWKITIKLSPLWAIPRENYVPHDPPQPRRPPLTHPAKWPNLKQTPLKTLREYQHSLILLYFNNIRVMRKPLNIFYQVLCLVLNLRCAVERIKGFSSWFEVGTYSGHWCFDHSHNKRKVFPFFMTMFPFKSQILSSRLSNYFLNCLFNLMTIYRCFLWSWFLYRYFIEFYWL